MKKYNHPVEMLQALCRAGLECMTDMPGSSSNRHESYKSVVAAILSLVIAIVVISFVGKYLWNVSVAELFTFARPVQSVWQIIALMLLMSLFR
jgi:hypothetical protein